ncbi:MAG: nucleotidyltransferase domain-containing protein [Planctomycetes bacterium]|nr:nucleotidyltransferase domain-containing protein [Planctomycetota bacterium]
MKEYHEHDFNKLIEVLKKMRKISKSKLRLLKKYFFENPEVSMAFLFGSQAKGQALYDSDVDIAVYFKPEERSLEWEERREYPGVTEVWAETEKILGENVDILVLNKAPSLIAFEVLHTGVPLVIKDGLLYSRFLLFISSAAMDFKEFIEDYWQVEQRSTSFI